MKKNVQKNNFWLPICCILLAISFVFMIFTPINYFMHKTANPQSTAEPIAVYYSARYDKFDMDYFDNERETAWVITGASVIFAIIIFGVILSKLNHAKQK